MPPKRKEVRNPSPPVPSSPSDSPLEIDSTEQGKNLILIKVIN